MPNQNEYLAKKSLLDTKQDVLTAGANININNNNVISVQGLPKDVKVDGSSVVGIDGNANIDLTGKQDALTAGNNITIQNNVISANIEANPQDTPTDDLDSIEIDGTVYNIAGSGGSSVTPNPVGTPTDTLTTVEIDGTVYDIAGSGGGGGSSTIDILYQADDSSGAPLNTLITYSDNKHLSDYDLCYVYVTVTASGDAPLFESRSFCPKNQPRPVFRITGYGNRYTNIEMTDTDFTVTAETGESSVYTYKVYTIFGIKFGGSGGGGSEYSETTLWNGSDSETMTLSESLENYDAILFIGKATSNGINYVMTNTWSVEDLKVYINEGSRLCAVVNDAWYEYVTIPNSTTFTRQDRYMLYISEIRGIKYGNGGGSGGETKTSITTLYNTFINSVGEITLTNKIEDYDFIMIDFGFNGTDKAHNYIYIPAEDFPNKYPYVSNPNNTNPHILLNPYDDQYARMIMGSADNKLFIFQIGQTVGIYGIYGIKCGSSGSGGGSKYSETILWTGTIDSIGDAGVLNKPLGDYDYLLMYGDISSKVGEHHIDCLDARMLKESLDNGDEPYFSYEYYDTQYLRCRFSDETHFSCVEFNNCDFHYRKIVGIKINDAGGGGGTSVEANPQEEPTDVLTKIKIEDTVYEIQGGGSSGESGLQQTVLWDYVQDNSGTIPYDIYSVTLRDNINNYDAITLELVSWSGDLDGSWRGTNISNTFFVDVLNNQLEPGNVVVCTFDQRSVKFYIHDNIVSTTVRNERSTNGLVRVYGLTFGGGKAASEIIPISTGDGTTSRTFTFDKTPKSIQFYWDDPVLEGTGWIGNGSFIWGQEYLTFPAHTRQVSVTGMMGGCGTLSYGADGKSVTINGPNAFQACNTTTGSGFMFVDYGGGGSGGSSEPDISDMTWTAITSTSYGQSTAAAIPQGTKRLVLTAEYDGIVTKVAEEKIENIQKLLDTSLQNTWNMGAEYADTAGNHTFVAMSVNNNLATAYSGYSGVVVKIYALS